MAGQCEKFVSVGHQSTLCLPDVMHVTGSPTCSPPPLPGSNQTCRWQRPETTLVINFTMTTKLNY